MMAGIRGKNTKPEIIVRKMLFANGYRFRINKKIGNARPDIILPKWNLCIFVHGCFWHRHEGCRYATFPKSNQQFWSEKFLKNQFRDKNNRLELTRDGWRVGVIWECAIRNKKLSANELAKLVECGESWQFPLTPLFINSEA